MAKKKTSFPGTPMAGIGVAESEIPAAPRDTNPSSGLEPLPNDELCGYRYKSERKQMCLPDMIGKGESTADGDVIVNTANGISSSKGERGMQCNYGQQSNEFGKNSDWKGANLTGL